jgi:SET domain-containing protein
MIKEVEVEDTKGKGKGVFAKRNFKKGELIFRYKKGKIVARKDFGKLSEWESDHLDELDEDKFEVQPAPACFVNHSCDPNAIAKGRSYFVLKSIKKGEEITVDYRSKGIFKNKWECKCGSKNCKGYVISDFFSLPKQTQKLYLPYTLKIIKQEYKRRHGGN